MHTHMRMYECMYTHKHALTHLLNHERLEPAPYPWSIYIFLVFLCIRCLYISSISLYTLFIYFAVSGGYLPDIFLFSFQYLTKLLWAI